MSTSSKARERSICSISVAYRGLISKYSEPPGRSDSLRRRRFFDDARFVHAFVTDKVRFARWGRIKIAMALRYKRIDSDIIAEALAEIDERAYTEALEAVIAAAVRRIGDDAAHTYEGRTRIFRAAVSRGFESDISAATIRRHLADRRD